MAVSRTVSITCAGCGRQYQVALHGTQLLLDSGWLVPPGAEKDLLCPECASKPKRFRCPNCGQAHHARTNGPIERCDCGWCRHGVVDTPRLGTTPVCLDCGATNPPFVVLDWPEIDIEDPDHRKHWIDPGVDKATRRPPQPGGGRP